MALKRLENLVTTLLGIILGGIVLHAPITVWLGTLAPQYAVVIKSWKELLMAVTVPLIIYIVSKRKLWPELLSDKLFWLITIYAGLHIVLLGVFWTGINSTLAGLAIDLRYLLYFSLVYVFIRAAPTKATVLKNIAIAGALIVAAFSFLQVTILPKDVLSQIGYGEDTIQPYLTVDRNDDYVRINGTLRGPNPLGAYMVIVLAVTVAYLLRERIQKKDMRIIIPLLIGGFVGLYFSYSRSALLAGIGAIGLVGLLTVGRRLPRGWWIGLFITLGILAGSLFALRDTSFISNVILHENPEGGSAISSNDDHWTSLLDGTDRMLRQPFGAGVGSTGSASLYGESSGLIIENQYLFIAHESGWLGLILFGALLVLILWKLWQRRANYLALGLLTSGIGLTFIGLLLPVWVDETVAIVWWGLAAMVLASTNYHKR